MIKDWDDNLKSAKNGTADFFQDVPFNCSQIFFHQVPPSSMFAGNMRLLQHLPGIASKCIDWRIIDLHIGIKFALLKNKTPFHVKSNGRRFFSQLI